MRNIFSEAAKQNEEIIEAEIYLPPKFKDRVLAKVTKLMSGFTRGDLVRVVKCIPDKWTLLRVKARALLQ